MHRAPLLQQHSATSACSPPGEGQSQQQQAAACIGTVCSAGPRCALATACSHPFVLAPRCRVWEAAGSDLVLSSHTVLSCVGGLSMICLAVLPTDVLCYFLRVACSCRHLESLSNVSSPQCCHAPAAPLQALSNSCWALSKLNISNEALLDALVTAATNKIHSFNAQNIANTVSLVGLFQPGSALCGRCSPAAMLHAQTGQHQAPIPSPLAWGAGHVPHACSMVPAAAPLLLPALQRCLTLRACKALAVFLGMQHRCVCFGCRPAPSWPTASLLVHQAVSCNMTDVTL